MYTQLTCKSILARKYINIANIIQAHMFCVFDIVIYFQLNFSSFPTRFIKN